MKPLLLTCHPGTPSAASTVPVWVGRKGRFLQTRFRIPGDTSELLFPPKEEPGFEAGLWERTCFEAFVMPAGGPEYVELNLSPSRRWAGFQFDRYREGMRPIPISVPKIVSTPSSNRYEISAGVMLPAWGDVAWRMNLAAVIEEKGGNKSYWALAHPPGPPDFHHPDCFVLELPPAPAP